MCCPPSWSSPSTAAISHRTRRGDSKFRVDRNGSCFTSTLGEAVAIRRGRCDLLGSKFMICESLSEVRGYLYFGPTKTHEGSDRRAPEVPS